MALETAVAQAVKKFEKEAPADQLKRLDAVYELFERFIAQGLGDRPGYDLAPISTLPTNVNVTVARAPRIDGE